MSNYLRSQISKAVEDSQDAVTGTEDEMPYEEYTIPRVCDVKVEENLLKRRRRKRRRTTYLPGDRLFLRVPASSRYPPDHRFSSDSSDPSDDENPWKNFYKIKKTFVPRFCPAACISPDYLYWVNTDGYFRENENIAGHGLVVRDHPGNPIIACSWFTEKPISPLYHQLKGVLEAYRVAKVLGIKRLQVVCNHDWTCEVLERFHYPGRPRCSDHPENDDYARKHICKICVKGFFSEHFQLFWPILKEIAGLAVQFIGYKSLAQYTFRFDNQIADYMAKYGKRYGREVVLRPTEFPQELKNLLYSGVFVYAPPGGFV